MLREDCVVIAILDVAVFLSSCLVVSMLLEGEREEVLPTRWKWLLEMAAAAWSIEEEERKSDPAPQHTGRQPLPPGTPKAAPAWPPIYLDMYLCPAGSPF